MQQVLTDQTEIDLDGTTAHVELEREAYVRRLREAGIRPPERWEEAPEDHAPPVPLRRGLLPLLSRIRDRLTR